MLRFIKETTFIVLITFTLYSFAEVSKVDSKLAETSNPLSQKETKMKNLISMEVEKYKLKNGMTVLLHVDTRIPQVYHQLLIKVGSRDEETGKTGLAHLFEHMLFKGTKKYTGEEYSKRLASIGAQINAYTTYDRTLYHILLPSKELEMVMEMEAERLNSLNVNRTNLATEIEVVKEERRLVIDNNPNEVFEPLMDSVFKTHSYRRPIIGSMKDVSNLSVEDCKEFYESYYAPNNAILVLAGDFDVKKAKKWIQKYYGVLEPSSIKKQIVYSEKPQKQARKKQIKRPVQAPTLAFAYRGPKAGEEGSYALEVLSHILTGGESSRLNQFLVYKHKLALAVGGFYYALKEEGIFIIIVSMAPGADLQKAKALIRAEIKNTQSVLVHQKELLKSVRAIMNDYISSVKSFRGKGELLAVNEAYFNDYRELFKDLDRYQKITAQTIKKYARMYLSPNKMSLVELVPK